MTEDDSDQILENDVLNQATTGSIQQKTELAWCIQKFPNRTRTRVTRVSGQCVLALDFQIKDEIDDWTENIRTGGNFLQKNHSQSLFHGLYCPGFASSFDLLTGNSASLCPFWDAENVTLSNLKCPFQVGEKKGHDLKNTWWVDEAETLQSLHNEVDECLASLEQWREQRRKETRIRCEFF